MRRRSKGGNMFHLTMKHCSKYHKQGSILKIYIQVSPIDTLKMIWTYCHVNSKPPLETMSVVWRDLLKELPWAVQNIDEKGWHDDIALVHIMSTNAIGNGAKVFGQMGGKLYLLNLGEELNVWEKRLNMGDSFHSSIKFESHTSWSGTRDDSPYFTFGFASHFPPASQPHLSLLLGSATHLGSSLT